jgi:hypothetical protein
MQAEDPYLAEHCPECETPTLGFVRLTLMPSDTELVESEEDPGQAAPSNRTP